MDEHLLRTLLDLLYFVIIIEYLGYFKWEAGALCLNIMYKF